MISSTTAFIDYFDGIRKRTLNYIRALPPDKMDWSPRVGELTCGDLMRHLAAAEKMFVGVVVTGAWKYVGHDQIIAPTRDAAIAHLGAIHRDALDALRAFDDAQLFEPRPALKGQPVKAWRWLMALVEHEVHHRSQLASYLAMMGVAPPQIYGLTIEDIVALTTT